MIDEGLQNVRKIETNFFSKSTACSIKKFINLNASVGCRKHV